MTAVADALAGLLKKPHAFEVSQVKVSELLNKVAQQKSQIIPTETRLRRTRELQQFGDQLRRDHGMAVVAGLVIREMDRLRGASPTSKRAFVIDCLKHPEEVAALRLVYGPSFFLVSSICDLETRRTNLRGKYSGEEDGSIDELMEIDAAEEEDWGQHVRKTIPLADYFVTQNIGSRHAPVPLNEQLKRLLELVTGTQVHRPSQDERGMYAAWGAAMRSACLSRQVGASILNPQGIVIATGTNEVPAPGGGLYSDESGDDDARCFLSIEKDPGRGTAQRQRRNIQLRVLGQKSSEEGLRPFCRNDFTKEAIWQQVSDKLNEALRDQEKGSPASPPFTKDTVKKILKATPIKDLVEFSRALHAEADALLSLARAGGPSCQGASLYVNVFPCHLCTRQIIAAGIQEVIYIEPYPKSMALILHDDAIQDPEQKDAGEKVSGSVDKAKRMLVFRLFSGVAPRRYVDLFEKHPDLKKDGKLHDERKRPFDPLFRKSHVQFEDSIASAVDAVFSAPVAKPVTPAEGA